MKRMIKIALLLCLSLIVSTLMFTACNITDFLPKLEATTSEETTPSPHAHTVVIDEAVAPTCTEAGLAEGKHCSVCNEVIKEQEFVKPFGHTEVVDKAVAPTCATTGLTEGKHCSICNATIVAQEIIAKEPHSLVTDAAVEATCTTTGLTEGNHCSICKEVINPQKVVAKEAHTFSDWIIDIPATCSATGDAHKECTVCHSILMRNTIGKTAHTPSDWITGTAATCSVAGAKHKKCTICHSILERGTIEKLAHNPVVDKAVAPTCTTSGLTEGEHCSTCGEVFLKQQIIPATGHSWGEGKITTAPTCTEDGIKIFTCDECKETKTEIIAKGHSYQRDLVNNPQRFNATWGICNDCGYVEAMHEHILENGKCKYCEVVPFEMEVTSIFDMDNDGNGDVFTMANMLPEQFRGDGVLHINAKIDSITTAPHGEYDEITDNNAYTNQPYPNLYVDDHDKTNSYLLYKVTAPKAGVYNLAIHIRLKDARYREAAIIINGETQIEYSYGWSNDLNANLDDTTKKLQSNYFLMGTYTYGFQVTLKEGENEIKITAPGQTTKDQLIRDLFFVWNYEANCEHNEVIDEAVAPTCTETGLTVGKHCSVCGKVIVAQTAIKALGHSYSEWTQTLAPTCTEEGSKRRDCDACEYHETMGVDALGHSFGEWTQTLAPTCTEKGSERRDCSACEHFETREIDALGHYYNSIATKETCFSNAISLTTCSRCNEQQKLTATYINFLISFDPINNSKLAIYDLSGGLPIYENGQPVPKKYSVKATDINTGKVEPFVDIDESTGYCQLDITALAFVNTSLQIEISDGYCTYLFVADAHIADDYSSWGCGWSYEDYTVPHTYNSVVTEPTKITDGYTTHTCSVCGNSYKDNIVPATGSVGLAYEINANGYTCTITGIGTCTDTEVCVPSTIDGYTVTAIGEKAFAENPTIAQIVLPETLTSIGTRAFYGCTGLTEFTIPKNIQTFGTQIFYKASNLKTIYYNSNYGGGESNPFLNNNAIEKVVFGGTTIPSNICNNCSNLKEIVILDSVATIQQGAFMNCNNIKAISIPSSVTSIGTWAFGDCTKLETVEILSSNIDIGYNGGWVFSGCTNVEEVFYSGTIESWINLFFPIDSNPCQYGATLYINGERLTEVVFSDTITEISQCLFEGCRSLRAVVIPDSIVSIKGSAFNGCNQLSIVYYGGSPSDWKNITIISGNDALSSASRYYYSETQPTDTTYNYWHYVDGVPALWHEHTYAYEVQDPNSTPIVVTYTCSVCGDTYTEAIVPTDFTVTHNNRAMVGYTGEEGENLVIPAVFEHDGVWYRVTSIGESAFYGCDNLSSIIFPDSIVRIEQEAFSGCYNLSSVSFSKTSKLEYIGFYGFCSCENLKGMVLPASFKDCGLLPFNGMPIVKVDADNPYFILKDGILYSKTGSPIHVSIDSEQITVPDGIRDLGTPWGEMSFSSPYITSVTIPETVRYIGSYMFYNCKKLTTITFKGTVEQWNAITKEESWDLNSDNYAVYCTDGEIAKDGTITYYPAEELEFTLNYDGESYSVTGIGTCEDTDIIIPEKYNDLPVTCVGNKAFYQCTTLKSVTLPDTITSIGDWAFAYCNQLSTIHIGSGVEKLGLGAFYVSGIKAVYISDLQKWCGIDFGSSFYSNTLYTASRLFVNNANVSVISIPEGTTRINEYAFASFDGLTGIIIPSSVTYIDDAAFYACSNLSSIEVASGNMVYHANGNCLIETNTKTIIQGSCESIIPTDGSVANIGSLAFASLKFVNGSITIPNCIISIEYGAFANCEVVIFCQFSSIPSAWNDDWNPDNCTVIFTP